MQRGLGGGEGWGGCADPRSIGWGGGRVGWDARNWHRGLSSAHQDGLVCTDWVAGKEVCSWIDAEWMVGGGTRLGDGGCAEEGGWNCWVFVCLWYMV